MSASRAIASPSTNRPMGVSAWRSVADRVAIAGASSFRRLSSASTMPCTSATPELRIVAAA